MPRRRPSFLAAILLVLFHAAAVAQTAAPEVVAEIRIHGNYRTPDDEVLRIAGIAVGSRLEAGAVGAAADRLRGSGRFEAADVRKRYRSLDDPTQIAIIIAVTERPGVEKGGVMPGPMKRLGNALMASPSLEYVDGYGFIAGGRLTWGQGLYTAQLELESGDTHVISIVTSPDRKPTREPLATRGTGCTCAASNDTMSSTRSASRPTCRVAICTMITMCSAPASVSPWPNRQRRSMIGTITPRRLSTPRTYSGCLGRCVISDHPLISRTAMMSTPY